MATRRSDAPTDQRSIPVGDEPIIPGSERMKPPDELRPVEAKIWRDITGRLPPEWFTADNAPLLKELCRHIAFADELTATMQEMREEIAAVMAGLESGSAKAKRAGKITRHFHALMRMHVVQSASICNISTKLRLTNQSRWQAKQANDQVLRSSTGVVKPWEAWSQ